MFIYTHSTKLSTQPNHHHSASKRRATFARQCALDAFGCRAIHHLGDPDFQNLEPVGEPLDSDEAVDGRKAISRWLRLAANADGEAADTAFETADELRRVLGLSWADLLGRRAA